MIAVAIVSLFAFPSAPAMASDPLLSGYGGPGSGEQVLINPKVSPPASGDGSLRLKTAKAEESSNGKSASTDSEGKHKTAKKAEKSGSAAVAPAYADESTATAGLPLGANDLVLLLLGAGLVGLIAFFLRRRGATDQ